MILNPREVIFKGQAESVILPGEEGVFEVASFHQPLLSRLISGTLTVNEKNLYIRRGIVKVYQNKVTIIVEER